MTGKCSGILHLKCQVVAACPGLDRESEDGLIEAVEEEVVPLDGLGTLPGHWQPPPAWRPANDPQLGMGQVEEVEARDELGCSGMGGVILDIEEASSVDVLGHVLDFLPSPMVQTLKASRCLQDSKNRLSKYTRLSSSF